LGENVDLFSGILTERRGVNVDTLHSVLDLAVELAREGREGRRIGTMFVVADENNVRAASYSTHCGTIRSSGDGSRTTTCAKP